MSRIATTLLASLVLATALPGLAFASDAESVLSGDLSTLELIPSATAGDAAALAATAKDNGEQAADDTAMKADDLKSVSGGQSVNNVNEAITNQELMATSANNTIVTGGDFNTGSVSFGANAFSGFNGVGVFVVNTGANSNLQGSIGVTVVPTTAQ